MTQGHHGALVAARNIRDRLSKLNEGEKNTLVVLSQEISGLFARDLEPHFRGEEEELLKVFENHVGSDDSDIKKILQDHQTIRALSTSVTQKDLQLFADTLTAHIRFEEDVFFPRVEKTLTEEEKDRETKKLLPYKPAETHVPHRLTEKPTDK